MGHICNCNENISIEKLQVKRSWNSNSFLELRGYIEDVKLKLDKLREVQWVNNKTRGLMLEFAVYNAQVNIYSIVTCVAEFIGGGIKPWYRIDSFRLSNRYVSRYISIHYTYL